MNDKKQETQIRNCDHYKTPEEAASAASEHCLHVGCDRCPYVKVPHGHVGCITAWLYAPFVSEKCH